MSLSIEWTATALQSLEAVLEYTITEFGEAQVRKLRSQIFRTVKRLSVYPQMGAVEPFSSKTQYEYRGALVIKEIKIIYRVVEDRILIIYVKNARLDEKTMLFELRRQYRK